MITRNSLKASWSNLPVKAKLIVMALVLGVVLMTGFGIYSKVDAYIANKRVTKLAADNAAAKERILKLEGQVELLSTQLVKVNERIVEADARVKEAEDNTANAKTHYITVRTRGPVFNSPTDAGKVTELTDLLDSLYPDKP